MQKIFMTLALGSMLAHAAQDKKYILTNTQLLEAAKVPALMSDSKTGMAVAHISTLQESMLIRKSHERGRCAGFELLPVQDFTQKDFQKILQDVAARKVLDQKAQKSFKRISKKESVVAAINQVSAAEIQNWVKWLSSFPTRYHKAATPNKHVEALKAKIDEMLVKYPQVKAETSLIAHQSTPQKTLRLHIEGNKFPDEIVVAGAHLDSINAGFFGPTGKIAPGADDDASGSASLLEALRHLLAQGSFERSVEFFWYAGEEAGLLGSAEVAASYKNQSKKVVGVLQLDMTLYPGNGDGKIVSMTDFTSPEMRNLLEEINRMYLNIEIINDECGYGCSDHASWYRNGYPAIIPSEATFNQMNHNIHTEADVIDSKSSFEHAAIFSKIAVAFVSHLANL